MLQLNKQRPIPKSLYHYTNIAALKSILSGQDGKGICFWAFSNKCKNDPQEIKMGEYLFKRVRSILPNNSSLLHYFSGYENTASVSFMEGNVNQHMLDNYGYVRLEFDLRKLGIGILGGGLIDCEYVSKSVLDEYADQYCEMISKTFNSIPDLQNEFSKYSTFVFANFKALFMMENDIMTKVLGMKEMKWSAEKEWRKVIELKEGVEVLLYKENPYTKFYLDKDFLTGITVFYLDGSYEVAQNEADMIRRYIEERHYQANVKVELFG